MEVLNIVCPVCTLYLRPGITLKQHLTSHPKQKVIEALVKFSLGDNTTDKTLNQPEASTAGSQNSTSSQNNPVVLNNQPWNQIPVGCIPPQNIAQMQGNHVFIYQQSMSTTSPHQSNITNPLNQQYVIPTVFNPQMMPYVYQQQQVIMSSNAALPPHIRALPFELPSSTQINEVREESVNEKVEIGKPELTERKETSSSSSNSGEEDKEKEEFIENIEEATSPVKKQDVEEDEDEVELVGSDQMNVSEPLDDEPHDSEPVCETTQEINNDEPENTPMSTFHSEWGYHSDLNKACQTQTSTSSPMRPEIENNITENDTAEVQPDTNVDQPEYFYFDHQNETVYTTTISMDNSYEQTDPIYTSANILHSNDHMEFVNVEEFDGMHLIINEFNSTPVVSQVDNFENIRPERPGVLMTIGEIGTPKVDYVEQRDVEESVSRESSNVNIRSDERMPPRGELSGQESIGGASDITWNRINYQDQGSSGMSNTYDLLARESWGEDSSNSNVPIYNDDTPADDAPTIISYTGPLLNYKCSRCDESFASVKDRKQHEAAEHNRSIPGGIGLEIQSEKKPKKLVIKPKKAKVETETEAKFDNTFTNRLKVEDNQLEPQVNKSEPPVDPLAKPNEAPDVKIPVACFTCNLIFDNRSALKLHKLQQHKAKVEVRNRCQTCGENFQNEYQFTDHLKIHPLECRLCGKLFYRKQNIQLHMKRHLGLKPHKCDLCEKAFVTKQKLEEHVNSHTGNAPIKCTLCNESFKRHSNLVQHKNRHHFQVKRKVKDYICFCGEVFHSKQKLAWHKEIHDAKPKACTQCSEKFIHMASLTRHMRRAHNSEYLPTDERKHLNVECPICKKTYIRSSLEAHMRIHSGQRPYTCLICNKDFTTKWNLKLHKWTHSSRTQKPFKCEQCRGAFIRETDYIAHMNSHKSVRPYTCNYCGAQFIRKYNCQRHVKEHENDKTFNCDICGKSFHRSYYLKDHMRVHSGVRPYTCHICGKTSTTKSNHNKHVQIHHAREPVSTEN